jgi:hypothetical protein
MKFKKIVPLRRKCDCGKAVTNHHYLCDKCWGLKEKRKHYKQSTKLVKQYKKAKQRKWYSKI